MSDKNVYPPGWSADRVRRVLDYYQNQSEDEAVAEVEAAAARQGSTTMEVPVELVPAVRDLIAEHDRRRHDRH